MAARASYRAFVRTRCQGRTSARACGVLPPGDAARIPAAGLSALSRRIARKRPGPNNDNAFDSGYINAASIFPGYDTPLGPLNFGYGINDEDEQALYMNLGRSF